LSRFINQVRSIETGTAQQPLEEAMQRMEQQVRDETRSAVTNALRRFAETIRPAIEAEVRAGQDRMRALLRREVGHNLLFTMRRLRSAASLDEWSQTLITAVAEYCPQTALFEREGEGFRLREARNANADPTAQLLLKPVSKDEAGAFAQVLESGDTVVALLAPSQVSPLVAALFSSDASRAHLFPILRGDRIAGLLYCLAGHRALDISGVELLTLMAGETLASRNLGQAAPPGLVAIHASTALPAPEATHREDREHHLRAARWAKARVARMFLDQSETVMHARRDKNLYAALQTPLDEARAEFERNFLAGSASMNDYLHEEIVQTLAGGDESALGSDYPGPLV
jgi:hypothetical protein